MGTALRKLFERHVEQLSKNPRIDIEKVRAVRYLHEFDRVVQGPSWNYPCETAYYRDASSSDSLFNVKIPLFAIHAEDDPVS
jgi:predicted alpha/beta-fold hydrolase